MPRRRRAAPAPERAAEPSRWRVQHGPVSAPERIADPETGVPVAVRRAIDTLGQMLGNGSITPEMHEAGQAFRAAFRLAALDPLKARSLVWMPRTTGERIGDRTAAARERAARAMDALGGPASPAGSCAWHVVGCELSIREWAARQGWNGRPVGHVQAQGILVAALGMLARHYGLAPVRPPARRHTTSVSDAPRGGPQKPLERGQPPTARGV